MSSRPSTASGRAVSNPNICSEGPSSRNNGVPSSRSDVANGGDKHIGTDRTSRLPFRLAMRHLSVYAECQVLALLLLLLLLSTQVHQSKESLLQQ
jgi:hypothetical protein